MALDELKLPYEVREIELADAKSEAYTKLNPNGRLPAIEDPNTGLTLWESGAILLYLVDRYDPEGKLSFTSGPEKYLVQQWLAFQISGQGPYFGQATWFVRFHPEKIQSAIDRYVNEIERILGVLDEGLQRNGTGWLVGNKMTIADLSFVTWAVTGEGLLKQVGKFDTVPERFPHYSAWLDKMVERPHVADALKQIAENRKAHGLP